MIRSRYRNVITLLLACSLFGGCTVGRFFVWNFADIRDHRKFRSRSLVTSKEPFNYVMATAEKAPKGHVEKNGLVPFDKWLEDHRTVAFLVIRRDTILYERYFKGYDAGSLHPSFSMAKSVVSMLVGCAIADGYIRDVQQPITDFIPEMKKNGWDRVTIEHVLQMTSGMAFTENYYSPFSSAARFYYGRHLERYTLKLKLKGEPGGKWEYVSGDTQLLGLLLQRAMRARGDQRSVTQYLHDRIWGPLGMEFSSSWSIDRKSDGIEKAFCCINAPARDFAKLGSLYLRNGAWRGQQLVPEEWVRTSTVASTERGGASWYRYQWWLPSSEGDFMAAGFLGQYIYVDPKRDLVMVRLGSSNAGLDWGGVFKSLAPGYE